MAQDRFGSSHASAPIRFPHLGPPSMADGDKVWVVVGGVDKGGILVRDKDGNKLDERLSTGAEVKEIKLEVKDGVEKLQYERITGTGPSTGFCALKITGK